MAKSLIMAAFSATLGVAVISFPGWKSITCILLYFLFLFLTQRMNHLFYYFLIFIIFVLVASWNNHRNVTTFSGTETQQIVYFTDQPDIDGNILRGKVDTLTGEQLMLQYKIKSEQEKVQLQAGLKFGVSCPITGNLAKPERRRNPNGFDYKRYLELHSIYWIFKADTLSLPTCSAAKQTFVQSIRDFRSEAIIYVNEHFPKESSGFVNALLFGDQKWIDEDELVTYQRLGLVHLLAISGLHVSFLAGFLFYLGIRVGVTRERMTLIMLLLLPIYIVLSGASPSVLRSCFMAMLFFAASLSKKPLTAGEIIASIYLLLLLYNPYFLYNIGFELSFSVAFSIIMSGGMIQRYSNKLVQLLVISVICQLAALPVLLYNFFEVSLLGIFLNVLFVPIYSSILLPFSIVVLLLHLVSTALADPFLYVLNGTFLLCNRIADLVVHIPLASMTFGKPVFWILLLLVVAVLGLFICWDTQSKYSKLVRYLLISLLIIQYNIQKLSPFGEILFMDIGQGDCIFIKLPFNRGNYLIDTGGSIAFNQEAWMERRKTYNTAEDIIIPLLKSKGIHHLDKLILTHPDADHIGSASEVLQHIPVKSIVIGRESESDYLGKDFVEVAKSKDIPIQTLKRGEVWEAGGVSFQVLHPYKKEENTNDASIVLYAKMGGLTWLFTGDFGIEGEPELIASFPTLRADVLKAGHHGSKTASSAELVETILPKVSIISAGKNNRYGHPHQEVLDVFTKHGVKIFRTDSHGAITYRFKNSTGTFSTQLP
ncbi:DNA internalization-related competence protein ComEC/Rec2 [Peribacillus psychrosaccharolyticus]|uniref:DNA internalization-related competence protein ComEC/Rec2 n=1 Tax=Peribacillus psychrosaccharolyticus TaxID=1407 RepID=A0A974RZX3_PERPY|nr:DNA internalization-related competence protein ComEC/Rec2 [Peribacillus psychrosaccharolyticus]MEC2054354.1 DNA internalization-related competence protein ComEC/Rec2 [Peribacillus psychrosaccharolyticus]MED3744418.1 DNA internalization-related competence protein ComEC/Rec2 [Peribacillus psychrosaccharolyticus]QQS99890.1 DNA internalization-related competence protein ComEC/Rec2 [Peribacillus psychrosaccharolyticus]